MEELSRECLMETLDVFSGLKRIGGSEDEHRACGYLIKKLQEWGIPCRVYECDGYVSTPIEASVTVEGMDQTFEALPRSFSAHCPDGVTAPLFYDVHAHDQIRCKGPDPSVDQRGACASLRDGQPCVGHRGA